MNGDSGLDVQQKIRQVEEENASIMHHMHQVQEDLEHHLTLTAEYERKVSELNCRLRAAQASLVDKPGFIGKLTDRLGLTQRDTIYAIKTSSLFDESWYLQHYPDVARSGVDPVRHYLKFGAKEGRNPGPQFDTLWYQGAYPDVAAKGMNPLLHYVRYGKQEGRQPTPEGVRTVDPFAVERRWLQQSRDEQAQLAQERQVQLELIRQAQTRLEHENSGLVAKRDALAEELAELSRHLDEQARQAEDQQTSMASLIRERDGQAQLAAERQTGIETLQEAKAVLERDKAMLDAQQREQRQENETLLASLHQAQEELEAAYVQQDSLAQANSVLMEEREALTVELAALGRRQEEQAQLAIDLQACIEALQETLAASEREKATLETQNRGQRQENETLLANLHQAQEELEVALVQQASLSQANTALAAKREALAEEMGLFTQRLDELTRLAEDRQADIVILIRERDGQAQLAAELQASIGGWQDRLTAQERELSTLVAHNLEQQQIYETLMVRHHQAQDALDATLVQQASLAQENLALAVQRDALAEELTKLSQRLDEEARLAEERQASIAGLVQELDGLAQLAAEREASIEALGEARAALEREKSVLVTQHLEQQQQNEALLAQLHQVQEELATALAERTLLEQDMTALRTQHDAVAQEVAALSAAHNELAQLAGERQSRIDQLAQSEALQEQKRAALAVQIDTMAHEMATLTRTRDELEKMAEANLEQAGQLTLARDDAQQEVAILAQKLSGQSGDLERLRDARATLEHEHSLLRLKLSETEQRADALDAELKRLQQLAEQERSLVDEQFRQIKQMLLSEAM